MASSKLARALRSRLFVWTSLAIGLVLAIGVLLTTLMVGRTERRMRETLLIEARLAALTVDPGFSASLSAGPEDLDNPDYLSLKALLAEICRLSGTYRFAYLVGLNADREIFFFADNEPADSADCSPAGQIYDEAPEGLHRVFRDGRESVEGPFTDRWGTWVSAFVPIHDSQSGLPIAVLGVDTDASHWRWSIITYSALPITLMLCLLLLILLRLLAVRSRLLLQESAERYRLLFTDSPDACLLLEDSLVTDCNRAAESLLGASREVIIGKHPADLSPPEQPDGAPSKTAAQSWIDESLRLGSNTFNWTHRRLDGSPFPAEVSISLMTIEGRKVLFTALRDISERKRMEEALQQQLEEKEILLRETHHRIMNNLAVISGFLYLQAESVVAPEAAASLHEAIQRVNGMGKLYEKMLLAGEFKELSTRDFIGDLADSVVGLFSERVEITLHKQLDDFALGSKTMFILGIIVNELLTNALKYAFTGRSEGTVQLDASKNDRRITLSLRDDGRGLPADFDPNATSGFGLSLVRILCRQIGAKLVFKSHLGTEVTLSFDL